MRRQYIQGGERDGGGEGKGRGKAPFVAYPEFWWDCTDHAVRSLCLDILETQSIRPNVVSNGRNFVLSEHTMLQRTTDILGRYC